MRARLAGVVVLAAAGSAVLAAPASPHPPQPVTLTVLATAQVAPGVAYEQFTFTDHEGRPVRGELMRVDPATPGLAFDLASGPHVASRDVVPNLMDPDAVAAVNGDFFDIRDTEAPLGVAVDRQRGLRNGVSDGWNDAFWVGRQGRAHIGQLTMHVTVTRGPGLDISTLNSQSVRPEGVGIYTRAWGTLHGYRVVDGQRRYVRMVVVRDGRVTYNRTRFPRSLKVGSATVLVGRGCGSAALASLPLGSRLAVAERLDHPAVVAVTGSELLLQHGKVVATSDPGPGPDVHPRTAVGIDEDTGQVLLLVVDGRQSFSHGLSEQALARLMSQLGADDALNLDGGGSSTMVARQPDASLAILNSPSDGRPRRVANGLEVTYDP